ncbi:MULTISPECIES: DUF5615 family PIN-like protein [Microcystis]|nr:MULTISPECIES: DUF5615 family PIN-like protein [Microcystis]MBD2290542.1 DUF5615 family PIN-like protein [Microcystis wesenbergii FACHB-1317]MCA2722662.1 DUF5615 family PIN-like protein [Microcystis sp. M176S2]MCA2725150.1 DUF5615 family PIN-like protein [Microcystis sp. M166S2]MCA2791751.1 DUF5615 family PIN-like protein [Microcystis sp. M112S2]MCA2894094.1 DUF5615 family PIN-like protein [Microcystis sp. M048S1]MCA2902133.1 DUF5615 family PIN-like protein [Microcystis sp. M035S1]NCS28949
MNLKLYMDENVHGAITTGLRLRGVDVLTVQEDGYSGIADPIILDRATTIERVIFTQDSDFLIEASRRQTEGIEFIGVVYGHQLMVSIGDCIRDLELIAKLGKSEEFINIIQYLPL